MNLLGLDIGDRRIGVAVSRGQNLGVTPLTTVVRKDESKALSAVAGLVKSSGAETVVYGVPSDPAGTGIQAAKVREFVAELEPLCGGAEFVGVDESFTTRTAEEAMSRMGLKRSRRKELVDRLAAVLILRNFIDSRSDGRTKKNGGQS